jgi:hypothetical protein
LGGRTARVLAAGLVLALAACAVHDQESTTANRPSSGVVTFSDDGKEATFQGCNLSVRFSGRAYRHSGPPIPPNLVADLESAVAFRYLADDYSEQASCTCFKSTQPAQLDHTRLIASFVRDVSKGDEVVQSTSWDENGRFGKTLDYESIISTSDRPLKYFGRILYLPHCLLHVQAGATPAGDIASASAFRSTVRPPMGLTGRSVPEATKRQRPG